MILIRGARQLLTLRGAAPRRGGQTNELGVIHDASILIDGEVIHSVGTSRRMENLAESRAAAVVDARGKVILPGFVDSHTRPIAAPPSAPEFAARIRRWTRYLGAQQLTVEASKAGPERLRAATPRVLKKSALHTVRVFAMHGTTAVEARSDYGIPMGAAAKGLRIATQLDGHPLDIATAFSAGPPGGLNDGDENAIASHLIERLLPVIRRRKIAGVCDVDCRLGGFGPEAARRILQAAESMGFRLKLHVDGEPSSPAIEMALLHKAQSIDGINKLEIEQIDGLADSTTIVTLLPGMNYQNGNAPYPPARDLIDRGAIVALSTGYDPAASPSCSMAGVLSLACTQMRMTPAEAISAATINGAAAIGRADRLGSIEPGKQADLAIFDVADYREIPFCFGVNLCSATIKKGRVIHAGPGWGGALAPLRQPPPSRPGAESPSRPGNRA